VLGDAPKIVKSFCKLPAKKAAAFTNTCQLTCTRAAPVAVPKRRWRKLAGLVTGSRLVSGDLLLRCLRANRKFIPGKKSDSRKLQ
jgi:hypothetical protein